jgi:hypothetical protein
MPYNTVLDFGKLYLEKHIFCCDIYVLCSFPRQMKTAEKGSILSVELLKWPYAMPEAVSVLVFPH